MDIIEHLWSLLQYAFLLSKYLLMPFFAEKAHLAIPTADNSKSHEVTIPAQSPDY